MQMAIKIVDIRIILRATLPQPEATLSSILIRQAMAFSHSREGPDESGIEGRGSGEMCQNRNMKPDLQRSFRLF
jgi:hypothetical protein